MSFSFLIKKINSDVPRNLSLLHFSSAQRNINWQQDSV